MSTDMMRPCAACAIGIILASTVPCNEAFFVPTSRTCGVSIPRKGCARSARATSGWRSVAGLEPLRYAGMVRPHPSTRSASDGEADNIRGESSESEGQEGSSINSNSQAAKAGWEEDTEEAEDAPELTKEFYEEVAARWNTTVEGAMEVEKDIQFDKALYDELRTRRDFGFEQDLGLELEKRNITKKAEVTKIVDKGLEALPGVTSSTTFTPSSDLTPREVVNSVLEALKNNDNPYHNHGVEVFIRFLSPSSAMYGVEMEGVARYLGENRNRALMHWDAIAYPRPLTLSGGEKKNKAFQPLKLQDTMTGTWHSVSVYMTLDAKTNHWLIESIIMKGDL
ncbi:unnamed protein product [Ascophyllum nodosum]